MKIFGDWKFYLTLIFTAVFSFLPTWWQSVQESKSLSVNLISRTPLQAWHENALPGMEIVVDGQNLKNPHLVILEVQNVGTKSIPANDFESPLAIYLRSNTTLVRANISSLMPADIDTELSREDKKLSLKPSLLNPRDKVVITAITSGEPPKFAVKARINGVSEVQLIDNTVPVIDKFDLIFTIIWGFFGLLGFALLSDSLFNSKNIILRPVAARIVAIVCIITMSYVMGRVARVFGVYDFWDQLIAVAIVFSVTQLIATALNKKSPVTDQLAQN